jgi:hypothetical protein
MPPYQNGRIVASETDGSKFGRRTALKTGLTGLAASMGFTGTASAYHETAENYQTVIDAVDAGADPNGNESITSVLEEEAADDTLIEFPEGRYYMDEQVRFTNFENFGLVGAPSATIVPANYYNFEGPSYRLFRFGTSNNPGQDLRVENLTIDQTAPNTGLRVLNGVVTDGLIVRDIDVVGQHDSGLPGPGLFNVMDPGGEGVVENFDAPDGAQFKQNTPSAGEGWWFDVTGIYANQNRGTLRFKDCTLGGFPSTGLYASWGDGQIIVDGGVYENSDTASIRIGADNSYVTDATVRVDHTQAENQTQRGIRVENGDGVRILDTDVEITEPNGDGIFVRHNAEDTWIQDTTVSVEGSEPECGIRVSGNAGETTIYRTEVDLHTPGGYGLRLSSGNTSNHERLLCQTVSVTGSVGDENARYGIINGRDNAEFQGVTIDQSSNENWRSGLRNMGDDCLIWRGEYRSQHYPIIDSGTGTWVEETYANSHGGEAAYALYGDSSDVLIKESTLVGGIDDYGSYGLRSWANNFSR